MTAGARNIILVDLSALAHPIWHTCQSDPDPNKASQQIVARVQSLAGAHAHVAVCCDSGPSFRRTLDATYKAQRKATEEPFRHQMRLAEEQLALDGFPVWRASGFEADDVIASATAIALTQDPQQTVLIISPDKDLLQLVGPRVRVMSSRDGTIFTAETVGDKHGVTPAQMRDYLSLIGDTADNIQGAPGIGSTQAAKLLGKFGSLARLYEELETVGGSALGVPPAIIKTLRASRARLEANQKLIALREDVPVAFDELFAARVPMAVGEFVIDPPEEPGDDDAPLPAPAVIPPQQSAAAPPAAVSPTPLDPPAPAQPPDSTTFGPVRMEAPRTNLIVRPPEVLEASGPWERQLDPRSMRDARILAADMHASHMFSGYGSPQAVLSTVMVGRELGLPAMASLRSIHNIEGRHGLSASLMVALILRSGLAEFFEPVTFDDKQATFVTKRKGARSEVTLTHTIEMARTAGLCKPDSNWVKTPIDMLVARAQSRLARMIYPDLLAGLYTPEELSEIRGAAA